MLTVLRNVEQTVMNTSEMVSSHLNISKSYSDVLKEIKEVSVSTNEKVKKPIPVSYAAITQRQTLLSSRQSTDSPNKRPRRKSRVHPRSHCSRVVLSRQEQLLVLIMDWAKK